MAAAHPLLTLPVLNDQEGDETYIFHHTCIPQFSYRTDVKHDRPSKMCKKIVWMTGSNYIKSIWRVFMIDPDNSKQKRKRNLSAVQAAPYTIQSNMCA